MTPEDLTELAAAAHDCDPKAEIQWDRTYETLTITCIPECAEPMRTAVMPRLGTRAFLVIRYRAPEST